MQRLLALCPALRRRHRAPRNPPLQVIAAGFSAESVGFGMGGGLLQKVNRDTMSFATKLCHIDYANGESADIMKAPLTDSGKYSLPGILQVKRVGGVPTAFNIPDDGRGQPEVAPADNLLRVVYDKGPVPYQARRAVHKHPCWRLRRSSGRAPHSPRCCSGRTSARCAHAWRRSGRLPRRRRTTSRRSSRRRPRWWLRGCTRISLPPPRPSCPGDVGILYCRIGQWGAVVCRVAEG